MTSLYPNRSITEAINSWHTLFGRGDILAFVVFLYCDYRTVVLKSGSFDNQVYSTSSPGEGSWEKNACGATKPVLRQVTAAKPTPPRGNPNRHSVQKKPARGLFSPRPLLFYLFQTSSFPSWAHPSVSCLTAKRGQLMRVLQTPGVRQRMLEFSKYLK